MRLLREAMTRLGYVGVLIKLLAVAPITANAVRDAMTVGLRHDLNHWDSLIVAAALAAKADAASCAAQ